MSAASKRAAARAVADLNEGTILASVDIEAPAERVFDALTTSEITKWWGSPETYQTTEWQADVRAGGRWRATGRGPDGSPFLVEGEYLTVRRPSEIVQTWKPDWDGGAVTTLRYSLAPIPGGTRLTLRHDGFTGRPDSCQRHGEGWQRVLGWLQGHFQTAPAAAPKKFFVCKLHGPRPTFPADMTPAEGEIMQAHMARWGELLQRGTAVLFGPVAEPSGVWGLGVLEVADESEARAIIAEDPALRPGHGFRMDLFPMLAAEARPA